MVLQYGAISPWPCASAPSSELRNHASLPKRTTGGARPAAQPVSGGARTSSTHGDRSALHIRRDAPLLPSVAARRGVGLIRPPLGLRFFCNMATPPFPRHQAAALAAAMSLGGGCCGGSHAGAHGGGDVASAAVFGSPSRGAVFWFCLCWVRRARSRKGAASARMSSSEAAEAHTNGRRSDEDKDKKAKTKRRR